MSKKRNWLDRISGWILDVLPAEKEPSKKDTSKVSSSRQEKKSQPRKQQPKPTSREVQVPKSEITKKSWEKFISKWKELGYDEYQFTNEEEVLKILETLEKGFKDDLIESLYRLGTNPEACRSLKDILDRGKVAVGDDLTAVRSFAYIGILIAAKPSKETSEKITKEPTHEDNQVSIDSDIFVKEDPAKPETNKTSGKDQEAQEREQDLLDTDLTDIGARILTLNSLYRSGYEKIRDLAGLEREDLLKLRNFGVKSLSDLEQQLEKYGLSIPITSKGHKPQTDSEKKLDSQKNKEDAFNAWRTKIIKDLDDNQAKGREYTELFDEILKTNSICGDSSIEASLQIANSIFAALSTGIESWDPKTTQIVDQVKTESIRNLILNSTNEADFTTKIKKLRRLNYTSAYRDFSLIIGRILGRTYAELGKSQDPKISRERVRQAINKISNTLEVDIKEWGNRLAADEEKNVRQAKRAEFLSWIENIGRIPSQDDDKENYNITDFARRAIKMNLKERTNLYAEMGMEITGKEFDYHYDFISKAKGNVGSGYWLEFGNLEEFLRRHASALGEKSLMPKQTTLPDAVRGVVTRFGGQKKVADRIGLTYQGQLVGEEGRTFWTENNLNELLEKTCEMQGMAIDLMPSTGQIFEYLQTTTFKKFQNKKPPSAIVALTKQGKLHWSEVAARFNKRFVIGESQKAITLSFIKAFVRDLGEHLDSLSPSELYVLFQSQGISRKDNERFSRTFDVLVDAIQSGVVSKDELSDWAKNNEIDSVSELLQLGTEIKETTSIAEKEDKYLEARSRKIREETDNQTEITLVSKEDLPSLDPESTLKALDKATEIVESTSTDEDKVQFLKAKATAKLWDACFKDEEKVINKVELMKPPLDAYSAEIKDSFLEEYRGSKALPIPDTYQFRDLRGNRRDPKLMQRLVAFRLNRDNQLLNLSGTGTGKTLSAIYAAQICGAKRILISCPNGVLSSWERAFNTAFPDAVIHVKLDGWQIPEIDSRTHVYMVNHERFQELYAERMLTHCVGYAPDMVVIDEIHQSKRRTKDKSSQRRKLMNEYLKIAKNITPQLKILGMSATPVINNLYEGRSLLELVNQETIQDVDEKIDLNSCMNLYQHFVRSGIRMNPGSLSRTDIIIEDINATELLPQVIAATKSGTYHDVEQILVPAKINSLSKCIERGRKTVVFITYIKSTLRPLASWLQQQGISHCVYTGNDKDATSEGFEDALDEFVRGNTEVLIASIKCVGTGVDGLQAVCDRAVFFQLPWTSTEFEQAIGRLDRDGTEFESIKVYLPMTDIHLPNGERWSWCRSKFDRIQSKRDIAKAAVDGEVPDAASMISPSEASKYWIGWLKRLEESSS